MNKHKEKHNVPEETGKLPGAPDLSVQTEKPVVVQEIERLKDQLLRMQADYDNFRKRSLREKGEIYENANEALLLDLLPILDHFQLAVKSAREHNADQAFQEGIQMISDQLLDTLGKYGLIPFSVEKQAFDPKLHEAISALPSAEPEGTIIAQSRQGYNYKNKLLRPAQVVVSSGAPKKAEKAEHGPMDADLQSDEK